MNRRLFLALGGGSLLIYGPVAWSVDKPLGATFGVSDGGVSMRLIYDRATEFHGTINPGAPSSTTNLEFHSVPYYIGEKGRENDNGSATCELGNNSRLRIRVLFVAREKGEPIFKKAGDVITAYSAPGKTEGSWAHVGNIIDEGTT